METPTPTNVQPETSDCQAQCLQLRKLVSTLIILLVIMSVTTTASLFYQYWLTRKALNEFRPQFAEMMAEYSQLGPRMDDFVNKIRQYGNSHPDFGPIMVKYRLAAAPVQAAPATPAPTVTPATPAKK
jgi:hypothetical protein